MREETDFIKETVVRETTVVRFSWPGQRRAAELDLVEQVEALLTRVERRGSSVLLLVALSNVLQATHLQLCEGSEDGLSRSEALHRLVRRQNSLRRVVFGIRNLGAYTVAAIDGTISLRMAAPLLACDYRIAGRDSVFRYFGSECPVAPAGATLWFLNRLVGPAATADLVLGGRAFDSHDALRLGLVNRVVPSSDLLHNQEALVESVAAVPRPVLRQLKAANVAASPDLDAFFETELHLLEQDLQKEQIPVKEVTA